MELVGQMQDESGLLGELIINNKLALLAKGSSAQTLRGSSGRQNTDSFSCRRAVAWAYGRFRSVGGVIGRSDPKQAAFAPCSVAGALTHEFVRCCQKLLTSGNCLRAHDTPS